MSDTSEIGIRVSLVGGRVAAVEAESVAKAVKGIGDATAEADVKARVASSGSGGLSLMSRMFRGINVNAAAMGGVIEQAGVRTERAGIVGGAAVSTFGAKLGEANTKANTLYGTLVNTGKYLTLGGVAAAGVFTYEVTKMGAAYNASTAAIAANSNISIDAAGKVTQSFLKTSGTATYSAQALASAYALVGGQLRDVNGAALNSQQATSFMTESWKLAEASGGDLNSTTQDLSKTLQTFNIQSSGAANASNIMYNTARLTGNSIDGLTTAETQLHRTLIQTMPSLGDMSGFMLDLAEHGQTGSRGVRTASSALNQLLSPSKSVNDMLGALNVHLYDSSGNFVGLQSVISQLQPALANLSPELRTTAEQTLFGNQAWQVMGNVVMDTNQTLGAATRKVTEQGVVHEAAEKKLHALSGQWEVLKAEGENWGVSVSTWVIPKLLDLGRWSMDVVNWFGKHKDAAIALAAVLTTVLGAAVTAFVYDKGAKMVRTLGEMGSGLLTLGRNLFGIGAQGEEAAAGVTAEADAAAGAIAPNETLVGVKAELASEYEQLTLLGPEAAGAVGTEAAAAGAGAGAGAAGAAAGAGEAAGIGAAATVGTAAAGAGLATGAVLYALHRTTEPALTPLQGELRTLGIDPNNWKRSPILTNPLFGQGISGTGSQKIINALTYEVGALKQKGPGYSPQLAAQLNSLIATVPQFQFGGTVPGPIGEPMLIMAHGGETVNSVGDSGIGMPLGIVRVMLDRKVLAEAMIAQNRSDAARAT